MAVLGRVPIPLFAAPDLVVAARTLSRSRASGRGGQSVKLDLVIGGDMGSLVWLVVNRPGVGAHRECLAGRHRVGTMPVHLHVGVGVDRRVRRVGAVLWEMGSLVRTLCRAV